jgi:hypothetical protein
LVIAFLKTVLLIDFNSPKSRGELAAKREIVTTLSAAEGLGSTESTNETLS